MLTRSEAARANGAKSRGPTTQAGKQKSSRNSLSHGFTAHSTIILKCENPEEFEEMVADYRATYQPATAAESQLVDQMIAARWRIRRLWTIETALLDSEIHRRRQEHADPDSAMELAEAFRTLADDSRSLHLISRYESRLHRTHAQAHEALRDLQNKKCETNPSPQENTQVPTQAETPITKSNPISPKEQTDTVGRECFPPADWKRLRKKSAGTVISEQNEAPLLYEARG